MDRSQSTHPGLLFLYSAVCGGGSFSTHIDQEHSRGVNTSARSLPSALLNLLPGLLLCGAAAAAAFGLAAFVPHTGSVLMAIVLGMLVRNLLPKLPARFDPGVAFASKPLLRAAIIALGFQLSLTDIAAMGPLVIVLVVVLVAGGFFLSVGLGRLLGVGRDLSMLIGCGFSICGAAAVAGAQSTLRSRKEDTAAAVALVVLFGTIMIGVVPPLAGLWHLDPRTAGIWTGAGVHEVAQVAAIGGILGSAALEPAVIVKLARVLMLAPVVFFLGRWMARGGASEGTESSARVPLVPLWVALFIVAAVATTFLPLPGWFLTGADWVQKIFLTAAMFGLGLGVHFRSLIGMGVRPLILAALVTLGVGSAALGGALLVA